MSCRILLALLVVTALCIVSVKADVPRLMSYQGKLTDDTGVPVSDGNYTIYFRIYTAPAGGNLLWEEDQLVAVEDGLFSVLLGDVDPIPDTVFTGPARYLALQVSPDPEMSERKPITSVAYAFFDGDWILADNVLLPAGNYGLSKRQSNVLHGTGRITHVNLGESCITGTSGTSWGHCTIGGGLENTASHSLATVGGGWRNEAIFDRATVGGGYDNAASGHSATVAGGHHNEANGDYATVGGGHDNHAHRTAAVGGGGGNAADEDYASVSGGEGNNASAVHSTVGGGYYNTAIEVAAAVGGGTQNTASGEWSVVGGGYEDVASASHATVGGGGNNVASSWAATIAGGFHNSASGTYSTVGGGGSDSVEAAYGGVCSGYSNLAGDAPEDTGAFVGGGYDNSASGKWAVVGGGRLNTASGVAATVGGGRSNTADSLYATVGGGQSNTASERYATVGSGSGNTASDYAATVAGGQDNSATANYATVSGGFENIAAGIHATVPGGHHNTADGDYSFAAGYYSDVPSSYSNSAAFNGQTATSGSQTRVGTLSKASGTFTIDHPTDPANKILNHYFVESPEMVLIYRGVAIIGSEGRSEVHLPDYFDALNRNPMVQLTGVGTSDVYVSEEVNGNRFAIGGKPGTKVYWTVTGDRKDQSAEITRILMPVEQEKEGELAGHSLDDDFLATTKAQLERMGKAEEFEFRTPAGREKYERLSISLESSK